jgi:RNA polymerase sigma-70 factor (ECF subfamily)
MSGGPHEEKPVTAARPLPLAPPDLETVFRAHHARVLQAAYRVTGHAADAEDAAQAVFLRLARRDEALPGDLEGAGAYLQRAGINAALDLLRRRRREAETPLDLVAPLVADPAGAPPDAEHRRRVLAQWLRAALTRLPPQAAEAFALHFFEGREHDEIAEAMGTTRNNVAVLLHRARRALREEIAGPRPGETP